MDDVLRVQVLQSQGRLEEVDERLVLSNHTLVSDVSVEISIGAVFKHDVEVEAILEAIVQFNDVGVSHFFLNFDLSTNLVLA